MRWSWASWPRRFDDPLLFPYGWQGTDGSVRVLGVPCGVFDEEGDPRCPDVAVHQLVVSEDRVERRELDLRVSSDAGFTAAAVGDGAVLTVGTTVVAGDERRFEGTAYRLGADGAVSELGPSGPGLICSAGERVVQFPSDVGASAITPLVIRELRDGEWVERGKVASLETPRDTAISGDVAVAVTYRHPRMLVDLVRPSTG